MLKAHEKGEKKELKSIFKDSENKETIQENGQ